MILSSFKIIYKLLEYIRSAYHPELVNFAEAEKYVAYTKKVSEFLHISNCLTECLVSFFLLRRRKNCISMCIGIKKEKNKYIKSHGWLEINKKPILENELELTEFNLIKEIF